MKTYQSVLPATSRKECNPERARERRVAATIKAKLSEIFANGFFFCLDCQARCERVEGEQGQPAHCDRCGSVRIEWNKPVWLAEPADLMEKEAA